jgi:hypothetical protein
MVLMIAGPGVSGKPHGGGFSESKAVHPKRCFTNPGAPQFDLSDCHVASVALIAVVGQHARMPSQNNGEKT